MTASCCPATGQPTGAPGCWVVVSLSEGAFKAVIQRYIADDGVTTLEAAVQEKLLEIVESGAPIN